MIIPRDRYLEQLVARKHNNLIKVVTGIRRCGNYFRVISRSMLSHLHVGGDRLTTFAA